MTGAGCGDLNPDQVEAALADGHCLVTACPGSGKTKTLAAKAARILADPHASVCAVTFTRDSALEIRERILRAAGDGVKPRLLVGTFHGLSWIQQTLPRTLGFGAAVLERMRVQGRFRERSAIATEGDRRSYVMRAIEMAGVSLNIEVAAQLIEATKVRLILPGQEHDEPVAERLCAAYQEVLTRNGKIDFQDIILASVTGMRASTVPAFGVTALMVDEFQDTDELQYEWVRLHAIAGARVTAVGDDDQCQPPDTQVMTERALRPMARLRPEDHEIVCFDPRRGLLGLSSNYRLARAPYCGPMIEVVTEAGAATRCTPRHKWLVANAASARPREADGAFVTQARYLAPGQFVPVVCNVEGVRWEAIQALRVHAYEGDVVSLDVRPHPYYVADGIVTHNSIYGWRMAMGYRGMERFADELSAQRVVLGINYRSRQEILTPAARVIANNRGRLPKVLTAAKGAGGLARYHHFADAYAEAEAVAREFCRPDPSPSRAVIARTNRRLDHVEAAMVVHHVAYVRSGGRGILDREEPSVFADLVDVACGRVATGIDHALAWAGVGEDDLRALHGKFGDAVVVGSPTDFAALGVSPKAIETWRGFARAVQRWREAAARARASLALAGIAEWMTAQAEREPQKRNVDLALTVLSGIDGPLERRVSRLRLWRNRLKEAESAVMLTTAHGSKGLEWDQVWIVGAEEGVIPDEKSATEEERRLMYVAMTRARESLIVSSTAANRVSRFVTEAQVEQVSYAA